ncbi:MAG: hypothetical protein GY932_04095, partial [Arcobacter sp.]|nr:hypothetical protein [Arcobacter sp.]
AHAGPEIQNEDIILNQEVSDDLQVDPNTISESGSDHIDPNTANDDSTVDGSTIDTSNIDNSIDFLIDPSVTPEDPSIGGGGCIDLRPSPLVDELLVLPDPSVGGGCIDLRTLQVIDSNYLSRNDMNQIIQGISAYGDDSSIDMALDEDSRQNQTLMNIVTSSFNT